MIYKGAKGWRWFYVDPSGRAVAADSEGPLGYSSEQWARDGVRKSIDVVFDNATRLWRWQLKGRNGVVTYVSPPFRGGYADANVLKYNLPIVRDPRADNPNSQATLVGQVPPHFKQLDQDEQDAFREAMENAGEQQGASGACAPGEQLTPECAQAAADALVQEAVEDLAKASGRSVGEVARAVSGGPLATVALANAFVDTAMSRSGQVQAKVLAVTSPPKEQDARRTPTTTDQATTPKRQKSAEATPEGESGGGAASEGGTAPEGGGASEGAGGATEGGGASESEGGAAPEGGSSGEATP